MMERAYSRSGGIASGDEVARTAAQALGATHLEARTLDRGRVVVNFEWQSQTLLPLFQFDLSDMSLHPGTVQVIENCPTCSMTGTWHRVRVPELVVAGRHAG